MTMGKTLKNLREKVGLTQKELAERMNVSPAHISQYERNLRNPSISQLKKFADALGVSFNMLLTSKFNSMTESSIEIQKDVVNNFLINDFSEKLIHIGYNLREVSDNVFIIENSKIEYKVSTDDILNLNEKCDLYLKFLLSEIKCL